MKELDYGILTVMLFWPLTALVSGITVVPLNSTSVRTPVNNLTVMYHYIVHYTTVGGVSGIVSFSATSSSGVVSGLQGGETYWFSVTVALYVGGGLYIGSLDELVSCKNFHSVDKFIHTNTCIPSQTCKHNIKNIHT